MLDTMLENYSKAVESTLRLQQEMLRHWTVQWTPFGSQALGLTSAGTPRSRGATPEAVWPEQFNVAQTKWAETVTEMLHRHQETLDEQYRAGIRALGDASQLGAAKDPEQFRCLCEELWRRSLETLETAVASQMHDVQAVMEKWYEAASLGATGSPGPIHDKT
jgi:hypothetical protein